MPKNLNPFVSSFSKPYGNLKNKNISSNLTINSNQIIRIIDSLKNTKYSIKFSLPKQPNNVLYNLVLATTNQNQETNLFVLKYTISNIDEVYENGIYDFSKMRGNIAEYNFYDFVNSIKSKSKKDFYSKDGLVDDVDLLDACATYTNDDGDGGTVGGGSGGGGSRYIEGGDMNAPVFSSVTEEESKDCNIYLFSNGEGNLFGMQWHCADGTSGSDYFGKSASKTTSYCLSDGTIGINAGEEDCGEGSKRDPITGECVVDDKLIIELEGKEKCVYDKLKNLNLFKTTINEFAEGNYNLTFTQNGKCNGVAGEDACTDPFDLSNGNITINLLGTASNKLGFAATLLHEGIHASIYRYVDRFKKGLDPNNRKQLFHYYNYYKALNSNDPATAVAQHQYMQSAYVIPLAKAIRKLDNYRYPIEDYYGFGWEGLKEDYDYDTYIDSNGDEKTMIPDEYSDLIKLKDKIASSTNFATDCK